MKKKAYNTKRCSFYGWQRQDSIISEPLPLEEGLKLAGINADEVPHNMPEKKRERNKKKVPFR